jgi:5-methylcytosine-specific restriction endonuclease McrA
MFDDTKLDKIFSKTDGNCHLCGKKLCYSNYGKLEGRGKWEVEHSVPKANGGTDNLNNLLPACVSCNRSKGKQSTRSARSTNGRTKAPYSANKKESIKKGNTLGGGLIGLGITALVTAHPVGLVIGVLTGSLIGNSINPDE